MRLVFSGDALEQRHTHTHPILTVQKALHGTSAAALPLYITSARPSQQRAGNKYMAPYISPQNITCAKGNSPSMGQKVMFKNYQKGNYRDPMKYHIICVPPYAARGREFRILRRFAHLGWANRSAQQALRNRWSRIRVAG